MASPVLVFASPALANQLVAGIPAAARALLTISRTAECAPVDRCTLAVAGGWEPSDWCRAEIARLTPGITPVFTDSLTQSLTGDGPVLSGEEMAVHVPGSPCASGAACADNGDTDHADAQTVAAHRKHLLAAHRAIIAATGKPTDGLVSRLCNRPISRFITRRLLRLPGVLPVHATIAAALIGVAMAAFLFFGGATGLIVGAILFQAASIIDGVDGEIARATFRSSARGAMLDTLTDAATNLAFIAGVSANLWQQGHVAAPAAGLAGMIGLAIGLAALGRRSQVLGGPFTFDAVKHHFRSRPSRLKAALALIATRDFYAAAFAIMVILGLAAEALFGFAIAVAVWLMVVLRVLWRSRPEQGPA